MITNQVIPSAPPPPARQRDYLSWSAISTYRSCPLKYYFRYVAGLPEETVSSSLVFGAAIHRSLEHHFRTLMSGGLRPSLDELLDHYQAEWQDRAAAAVHFGAGESRQSLGEMAGRLLASFQASEFAQPKGSVLAVEEDVRGPIMEGLPDLWGRVDLIVETGKELLISDWKTARARWSEQQVEDGAEQLLLYADLVREFAPGKTLRLDLVVLTKTRQPAIDRHSLPVETAQLDRTKQVVAHVWRAIEAEQFYPAPSPMTCGGCPFRQPCRQWPD